MATQTAPPTVTQTLETLQQEVAALKERVAQLENRVGASVRHQPRRRLSAPPSQNMNQAEMMAWLKAEGIVREPTEEEIALGAEWNALSGEEKTAALWELDHLPPEPMISDIIIENRR
jgi:hypothetical protein